MTGLFTVFTYYAVHDRALFFFLQILVEITEDFPIIVRFLLETGGAFSSSPKRSWKRKNCALFRQKTILRFRSPNGTILKLQSDFA